jgi:peptide-methionine (S)-S-oxide reductase
MMRSWMVLVICLVGSVGLALGVSWFKQPATSPAVNVAAAPVANASLEKKNPPVVTKLATFGAGCFWGVEDIFRNTPGVVNTAVGYMGGSLANPTYENVCSDSTGHAEVVQVQYDPSVVTYDQLLEVFWRCHNPTLVNRQGPDVGTQYRSAIFVQGEAERQAAEASKARLDASGKHAKPIATSIEVGQVFWKAEDYHQQYLEKRGLSNCHKP